ncbi:MAG: hypothetical protein AAGF88_04330 [Pseudomonadota bacterium]
MLDYVRESVLDAPVVEDMSDLLLTSTRQFRRARIARLVPGTYTDDGNLFQRRGTEFARTLDMKVENVFA